MKTLLFFILTINLSSVSGQDIFKVLSSNTWYEENGWLGRTLVFVQTNNDQIKAFRQQEGSGVLVLFTEIFDVTIKEDTVFLSKTQNEQQGTVVEKVIYTYSDSKGLSKNGTSLRITRNEPIIYLSTESDKIIRMSVDTRLITKYDFDKNLVYVSEKSYIINPKRK